MGFFKGLAENFTSAYGDNGSKDGILKKILSKIILWVGITFVAFCIFHILWLFQCSKPSSGNGTCLSTFESGATNNSFSYDFSNLSASGDCNSENPYAEPGQNVDWIDTGFETNGKQLVVYASGNYFPWGEQNTTTTFGYHTQTVKQSDGTFTEGLTITQDYKECVLNTDLSLLPTDTQETKKIYRNQFNNYSTWNANNRKENSGKKLIELKQQADCIKNNNCYIGQKEENNISCVLKNGAGIYLKIGTDTEYAYHIKNYSVPDMKLECLNADSCKFLYRTSNNGYTYNLIQVPFALPPVIYQKGANDDGFIFDIRDNILKDLLEIKDSDSSPEYNFTTIALDKNNEGCIGEKHQLINGLCYQNIEKQMTLEEINDHICIQSSKDINLADELCPPQANKKLFIKPANTCYEGSSGTIKLTFTSGVKPKTQTISLGSNGLKLSWIMSFISVLYEPFFGSQQDKEKINEVLQSGYEPCINNESGTKCPNTPKNSITFCRDDGKKLYYSTLKGDFIVKTEKYSSAGIKLYDFNSNDYDETLKTTKTMDVSYIEIPSINNNINRNCVSFRFKDKYQNKQPSEILTSEIKSSTNILVKMSDMDNGLFVKIRNAIMSSSVYNIARIMIVVWFVFSFGLGFINKEKILSKVPLITSDWKRFLILLWCSDQNNYELIDEILWPGLIYGSQSISSGIIEATSAVYGTSIDSENPLEFVDEVISMVTSKETFYKLGAVATSSIVFIMFFFIFPFLASSLISFMLAIVAPIINLGFTMFNFGQIIMLMPVYALISLFGMEKDKFTKAIKTIISEFIHFAFALGFFGMCIGFMYHYFLKVMNIKVCWLSKIDFSLLLIIPIKKSDWFLCNSGGTSEAGIADRFGITWDMLKNTFAFSLVVAIMGKISMKISDMLADVFAKGGKMFGLGQSAAISGTIGSAITKGLGNINKALRVKNKPIDVNNPPPPPIPMPRGPIPNSGMGGNQGTSPNPNNNGGNNNGGNSGVEPRQPITTPPEKKDTDLTKNKNTQKNEGNTGVDKQPKKDTNQQKDQKDKEKKDLNEQNNTIKDNKEAIKDNEKDIEKNNLDTITRPTTEDQDKTEQSPEDIASEEKKPPESPITNNDISNPIKEEIIEEIIVKKQKDTKIIKTIKEEKPEPFVKEEKPAPSVKEEKPEPVIKEEKNEYRGSGLQENNIVIQENDVVIQENDAFLKEQDAVVHDALMGEPQTNDLEQQKKDEEEERKKEEKDNIKKEEAIKKNKEIMEQIKENKKQQEELEKQQQEKMIEEQRRATERLKKEVEEANRKREEEERKRIENDKKIKAEQEAERIRKAQLEAEKQWQETIRKGSQSLSPKQKKDEWTTRTKRTTSMKTAADKWSRLSSGRSSQIKTTKTTTFRVKKK